MKCTISGTVLKVYKADRKDKEGKSVQINMLDLYDGDELVRVAKIPENVFGSGESVCLAVKVYGNQYGVSCVYVATVNPVPDSSPRK